MTFLDYLMEQFAKDCQCVKDDFEEHFDNWLSELDGEDYIQYGNEYGEALETVIHTRYNEVAKKLLPGFKRFN